jgi:hypothetical protein
MTGRFSITQAPDGRRALTLVVDDVPAALHELTGLQAESGEGHFTLRGIQAGPVKIDLRLEAGTDDAGSFRPPSG